MKTLPKFSSVHAQIHNHFTQERHLIDRQNYKARRSAALAEWNSVMAGIEQGRGESCVDRRKVAISLTAPSSVLALICTEMAATRRSREAILSARLAAASPPLRALRNAELPPQGQEAELPLYPGVVQRGAVAFSERSGAALAIAPADWTDGCAVLRSKRMTLAGIEVAVNAYLDPRTGHTICVDSISEGEPISFASRPTRWSEAAAALRSSLRLKCT